MQVRDGKCIWFLEKAKQHLQEKEKKTSTDFFHMHIPNTYTVQCSDISDKRGG
jgi:hypothetical protein